MSTKLHVYIGPFVRVTPDGRDRYCSAHYEDYEKNFKLVQVYDEDGSRDFVDHHIFIANVPCDGRYDVSESGVEEIQPIFTDMKSFLQQFEGEIAKLTRHYGTRNVICQFGTVRYCC